MIVLIKPLITERSMKDATSGRYTFIVNKKANKNDIRVAVKKQYKVDVKNVATNIVKGKSVKFTRAGKNTRDLSYKKARVTLKNEQKIDIFEEIGKEEKK